MFVAFGDMNVRRVLSDNTGSPTGASNVVAAINNRKSVNKSAATVPR